MFKFSLDRIYSIVFDTSFHKYPSAPFNPPNFYPELKGHIFPHLDHSNRVYEVVREVLHLIGLDQKYYDSPDWNPLSEIVKKSDKVIIKPNFVIDTSMASSNVFWQA